MTKPPQVPLDRTEAMTCLWSNLAIPGVGSWRAGWRVSGALQLTLATIGFLATSAWGAWFLREWAQTGRLPFVVIYENEGHLPPHFLKPLLIGGAGVGLFVLALGWAFVTSLLVWQAAKRPEAARE